jgi:hypothetical protein
MPSLLLAVGWLLCTMQGVGCSGGQNPDDCLPFVYSAKEGQKAREDMEAFLLPLAGKNVTQVRSSSGAGRYTQTGFTLGVCHAHESASSYHRFRVA